ncbi:glutamate--tRNA ligase [Geoalkalibacter subterraneus]|uniref:Glutamate--tRNA ligase n=1 Tax=Geoalkalibacter subterraneus TaxID=483547 RepID=A0A0B5FS04_9BACT|nr:glutamate--tRNA ligase [Geoalkalibacter subterraneus]AJF06366.1 glutamyl-tRNA synthetase [Geoalkalibacter subterraneus]
MSDLRVRFAPSPTGYLHIGGARTALFNYLLARKEKGTFVLRIEDTDVARSTQESTDAILNAMEWLGLSYDEGPYYQSERFDLYREKVEELLEKGLAYRCYCTPEELEEKRKKAQEEGRKPKYDGTCRERADQPEDQPYVVRFRSPQQGAVTFVDRIKGAITFSNDELDDLIIQRTDGTPTYNFVVVIDDATMGINLIIRGDDHINNTPRQILLYQALGYDVPTFAHVPMILGEDKTRLSKRHGATSVMAYREMGYLPEALVNYLVRLGWSHGDQEIFSMQELIEKFSLEHVGKAAGVFNPGKLLWLNEHYIKTGDPARLGELLRPFLEAKGLSPEGGPALPEVVTTLRDRAKTLVEMADGAAFYYKKELEFDGKAVAKFLTEDKVPVFKSLIAGLEKASDWNHDSIEAVFNKVMKDYELKLGKVAQPVRVALTGGTTSPSIFEVIQVLGRETTLRRLKEVFPLCGA